MARVITPTRHPSREISPIWILLISDEDGKLQDGLVALISLLLGCFMIFPSFPALH
jgi:hypothetical protein